MQLANRIHLGKIFVCTALDTTLLVTDLSEWRLRIYMYAMQMVCQHITHILRQCVNCVPTNSTYTKPYSSHIHLTFQGPRLQLPVQPSGPGLNDKTSATNVHF